MSASDRIKYLLLILSVALYVFVGYGIERTSVSYFTKPYEFVTFIACMGALFTIYAFLLIKKRFAFDVKTIVMAGVLLRLSLLFITPNLSDDYNRFIWDGQALIGGENPYLLLPDSFVTTDKAVELGMDGAYYDQMNSKEYYTVYPPLNQVIFAAGAKAGGTSIWGNVVMMRLLIFLAELGSIFLIIKLLQFFKRPLKWSLIYVLNPLVILELTGNLHFEGVMIFFMLLALYLLIVRKNWEISALAFAGAIMTKLLPLMLLPLFFRRLKWRSILYYIIVGFVCALMFLPFISKELIENFASSLDLYFQRFEFNASVYYLLRWVGEQITGWNLIQVIGPALGGLVLIGILFITFREKEPNWEKLFSRMLFVLTIYFALATIVHPWYLSTLILCSVFTGFRYAIVWSALIFLTYFKYNTGEYLEPYWLITIEYALVGAVMFYEFSQRGRRFLFQVQ